jgi:hypothetical protein
MKIRARRYHEKGPLLCTQEYVRGSGPGFIPGRVEQISSTDSIRLLIVHLMSLTTIMSGLGSTEGSLQPDANRSVEEAERYLDACLRSTADHPRTAAPHPFHRATRPSKEGGRIDRELRTCRIGRSRDQKQKGTIQAPSSGARTGRSNRLILPFLPFLSGLHSTGSSRRRATN